MEKNTNISERIKQFIDYKRLSVNKFSDSVGASNSYFNKTIKNNTTIGSDRLESILRTYPEINPLWLLTGKGNMLKETKSEKIEEETRLIPLYGGVVTASLVGNTMDPTSQPIEMINAGDWFKDGDCAMRVYGDSMSPNYTSGSIVVMKEVKNKALILPGEDYMVETSEYRVLKRLQKSEVKGCILACSTNEEVWESGSMKGRSIYEPFDIFIDDITRLYLILGTVRRNHN
ncbi:MULTISPECIES: helix-turn-helix transcriptional regulator [Flavobacterium]|uniref:S24 family peptidase n=1 Tax=Flavobacterium keumense TaxID=1306518 RepID=A0ABY8N561_9FLAO|nr:MULTISPECIES: S24 family peptidase [Flavobacterium]WGK93761.1 S24 family peptidase [Flavobacterium keumense]